MDCEATCIINVPLSDRTFIAVRSDRVKVLDCTEIGGAYEG